MPASCYGYGDNFSLTHALDCCKDNLITQHHNEIRDVLGNLAALGYQEVVCVHKEGIQRRKQQLIPIFMKHI